MDQSARDAIRKQFYDLQALEASERQVEVDAETLFRRTRDKSTAGKFCWWFGIVAFVVGTLAFIVIGFVGTRDNIAYTGGALAVYTFVAIFACALLNDHANRWTRRTLALPD